jgi:ATP-dependent Zn protease
METIIQSTYSEFIDRVKTDRVQKVTISNDRVEYVLKAEFGSKVYQTKSSDNGEDLTTLPYLW